MQWKNLKNNKCPKCNDRLSAESRGKIFCQNIDCGFMITKDRFDHLVNDLYKIKRLDQQDNQSELNNL